MAVPFALPEDEVTNLIAAVVFLLSQSRFHTERRELKECMELLIKLLAEEIRRRSHSTEYDIQLKRTLLLLQHSLTKFPAAVLNNSEVVVGCNNNPDKVAQKLREDSIRHCLTDDEKEVVIKQGFVAASEAEEKQQSLLQRIVPKVRRTLWTAIPVICMIGWHLFQSNRCI